MSFLSYYCRQRGVRQVLASWNYFSCSCHSLATAEKQSPLIMRESIPIGITLSGFYGAGGAGMLVR